MKLIAPPTPASFTSERHPSLPRAAAPTAVPLAGVSRSSTGGRSGEGSVIKRVSENESEGEEAWTTVHVREVGLWIMGSRAEDGGYVSVGGVHLGPSESD